MCESEHLVTLALQCCWLCRLLIVRLSNAAVYVGIESDAHFCPYAVWLVSGRHQVSPRSAQQRGYFVSHLTPRPPPHINPTKGQDEGLALALESFLHINSLATGGRFNQVRAHRGCVSSVGRDWPRLDRAVLRELIVSYSGVVVSLGSESSITPTRVEAIDCALKANPHRDTYLGLLQVNTLTLEMMLREKEARRSEESRQALRRRVTMATSAPTAAESMDHLGGGRCVCVCARARIDLRLYA